MSEEALRVEIAGFVQQLAGQSLDDQLQQKLNSEFGRDSEFFNRMRQLCLQGVEQGWLCNREQGGIKFGRVFKPADDLAGFSVDVVEMDSIRGPYHVHPQGEIDLVMPVDDAAEFDGQGAGWKVYEAGSAHYPTVTGGKALVLYLLPNGEIEFTRPNPA